MKLRTRRFFANEGGAAMTEFVIGLPMFILIFSAMGAMYQFHHGGILAKGEAYSALWSEDANGSIFKMSPAGALGDIGSVGDVWQNGLSGAGIYVDSGVKTMIPSKLMPGSGIDSKTSLSGITGGDDDAVNYRLLNDFYDPSWDGSSFAGAFSSIIKTTGTGLGIGAGIRYGAAQGSGTASVSTGWGAVDYDSGEIDLPARTAATHRIAPVILTRLEFSLTDRFDEAIPVFDTNLDFSSDDVDTKLDEADSCQTQANEYQSCVSGAQSSGLSDKKASKACKSKKPGGKCGGIAGSNPLGNFDTSWCGALGGC